MKINLYLSTAVAGLMIVGGEAYGQCVSSQDCAALGYTETSCSGGGVKCPFGNKWFCADNPAQDCEDSGFKYTCTGSNQTGGVGGACAGNGKYASCTCADKYKWSGTACVSCGSTYKYKCTGTGYSGGSGTACGNYYTSCTCSSGYEWKDGSCQILNGAQGDLYYCNGTVVGVKASGMKFYVAMKDLGTMTWSSANSSCKNYSFCGNAKGTLPTKNQLVTIYNNKSTINSLLSTKGGTKMTEACYWSSTFNNYNDYYYDIVCMSYGTVDHDGFYNHNYYVRPVLAF